MIYELEQRPSRFQPPAKQLGPKRVVCTTLPDVTLSHREWEEWHRQRGRVIADPHRRGWWDNYRIS
jgi:hypothetical protein